MGTRETQNSLPVVQTGFLYQYKAIKKGVSTPNPSTERLSSAGHYTTPRDEYR